MTLTPDSFKAERDYSLCVAMIGTMVERGLLTPEEAEASRKQMLERFNSQLGGLIFQTKLS